ncbi:SLC13 family permease [Anaerobacillus isosaccharinicus]|uniref:SLC13 family permease n=1 Tax=Anaerobacillus isosaccharinicus TaxID=1532552 RepID=A0A1S2KVR8_9BACI|nr:SLC13 family permease [Anaerobacillus isosaccharinicus]MBA5585914.1 SLC13 family permease [Anaerobacillus isosaccharinicus]QOY35798.1 SLC13 family permease [Anaerobacillus isosaccharinicus]
MEPQLLLTFLILLITTIFFMMGRFRADLIAMCSLLVLVLTGIITTSEALAGFSNSIVIMIAGLFVVGGGIFRTGLARLAGNSLLKFAGNSEIKLLFILMILVALLSAFMSNTGTVAVLMPVVISLALGMKKSPALFLIPLAFASSLGGVLTLIGTPPNLIVSQTLADNGYERLAFFDFTPVGIVALFTGVIFLMTVGKKLLPKGDPKEQFRSQKETSPLELADFFHISDQLYRVKVQPLSQMINKRLAELQLPKNYQVGIIHIERRNGEKTRLTGIQHIPATSETVIKENDILYVQGPSESVARFKKDFLLWFNKDEHASPSKLVSKDFGVAEVLLTPHSSFINESIAALNFREKYNLNILGINRRGKYQLKNWATQSLKFGDALLVQGRWSDLELLAKETEDVVVLGQTKEQASMAAASGKAPIAGVIMLGMLVMMTLEIVPAVTAVLIAAVLMIMTGCLRNMEDAYGRINWESVVLIAAMLPMATALEKTGGVLYLSDLIIGILGIYGPIALMGGFYFTTMLFSQFISNTATAVLFAPIAITTAINVGASPYPFLIAVSVAASMAFATPVASPTNALVMTAGGYKFSDFVKVGVPLQLVIWAVMMITIPYFFPF